jgi:antirestriction protein
MSIKAEELLGYICGINKKYDVMVIGIFVKNNSVQLLGPNGSHMVHSTNNIDMNGFKREAAIVWDLTDIFDVPRDKINSEEAIEKIAQLKQTAAGRKTAAEEKAAHRQK